MRFIPHPDLHLYLTPLLCALLLSVSVGITAPSSVLAQSTQYDQTYGSGTYNQGDFGGTTQPESTDPGSTPESTPSPTSTPAADGLFPGTGAGLGVWAAIGALLLATGLGFYGFSLRQRRRA